MNFLITLGWIRFILIWLSLALFIFGLGYMVYDGFLKESLDHPDLHPEKLTENKINEINITVYDKILKPVWIDGKYFDPGLYRRER